MRLFPSALALLALAGCGGNAPPAEAPTRPIGVYSSLPLFWSESGDISELLQPGAQPHWALGVLARHGQPVALDTLSPGGGPVPLPADALLILAQPRPLSPDENVALDAWVRGGGRVLLLADPMLTAESRYALGDARRPQDVAMLSPILARWGLELRFDEAQLPGERMVTFAGEDLPVHLAGTFALQPGEADCQLQAADLIARCQIGKGSVLALADAALMEDGEPDPARPPALDRLLRALSQ